MRDSKRRRALELAKDALIVLLACSALWLAARTQLISPLSGLLGDDGSQTVTGVDQTPSEEGGALTPMAMVVNLPWRTRRQAPLCPRRAGSALAFSMTREPARSCFSGWRTRWESSTAGWRTS